MRCRCVIHFYTTPFNGLFSRTTQASWYQKGETSLDLNETRDDGVWGCSGISWTICKRSAPRSRQTTTPTPHHSIFYRPDAVPDAQPTVSKHCRHNHGLYRIENYSYDSVMRIDSARQIDFPNAKAWWT